MIHLLGNDNSLFNQFIAEIRDEVIQKDPMLATGSSMEIAYHALLEKGVPSHIHLVSVIASRQGIDYVMKMLPNDKITLWVGAIDPEMTPKSYIVPGLGDAGDLAFGEKMDSKERVAHPHFQSVRSTSSGSVHILSISLILNFVTG